MCHLNHEVCTYDTREGTLNRCLFEGQGYTYSYRTRRACHRRCLCLSPGQSVLRPPCACCCDGSGGLTRTVTVAVAAGADTCLVGTSACLSPRSVDRQATPSTFGTGFWRPVSQRRTADSVLSGRRGRRCCRTAIDNRHSGGVGGGCLYPRPYVGRKTEHDGSDVEEGIGNNAHIRRSSRAARKEKRSCCPPNCCSWAAIRSSTTHGAYTPDDAGVYAYARPYLRKRNLLLYSQVWIMPYLEWHHSPKEGS